MPVDLVKSNPPSSPQEDRRRGPPKRTLSDPPSEPSPRTITRRSSGNTSATTSPTGQVAESPEFSPRHIRRTSTLTRFPIKISTEVSFPTSDPSSTTRSRARSLSQHQQQQQQSPTLEKKPTIRPSTPPRPSVESRPSSDDFSDRSLPYSSVLEQPSPGLDFPPPLQVRPQAVPSSSSMSTSTKTMNTAVAPTDAPYMGQQSGGGSMKMSMAPGLPVPMPNLSGQANGLVGNLLKGPIDANGKLKDAALMVGIKMDLEAEVHLTARVRGDILVGLY